MPPDNALGPVGGTLSLLGPLGGGLLNGNGDFFSRSKIGVATGTGIGRGAGAGEAAFKGATRAGGGGDRRVGGGELNRPALCPTGDRGLSLSLVGDRFLGDAKREDRERDEREEGDSDRLA